MAKLFNRAKMTVTSTGTGALTLGSNVLGYSSFATAGVANGDTVSYTIEDGANWEIGTGTYTTAGTTLSRTVTQSYNGSVYGTSAISVTTNAQVFITALAADLYPVPVSNGGTGLTSLTAGYIPYGNGTGAFSSNSNFSISATNVLNLSGATSYAPQIILNNSSADTTSPYIIFYKGRASNTTSQNGDILGTISWQGRDTTNTATAATYIDSVQTGASGTGVGSVPAALRFNTINTERMRIDSAGNVGINVIPNTGFITGNKFEVNAGSLGTTGGNISSVSLLDANDGNYTTFQTFAYRTANGTTHGTSEWRQQRIVDTTRMGYIGYGSNYISFGQGTNSEQIRIDSSGNVGIGTTSPSTYGKLAVNGTIATLADTNAYAIYAGRYNSGYDFAVFNTQASTTGYDFQVNGSTKLRIDNAGNVGIGTTTPRPKLELSGPSVTMALTNTSSATDNKTYDFLTGTTSFALRTINDAYSAAGTIYAVNRSGTSVSSQIWYYGASSEAMRIDSAGSVGIGSSSPAATLYCAKSITGANPYGIASRGLILSDVTTTAIYYDTGSSTQAAAFTLGNLIHYRAYSFGLGAGSSLTNQYGFYAPVGTEATSNYQFYCGDAAAITSGKTNYAYYAGNNTATGGGTTYNFYANGTANNYFAGNVGIGATAPSGKLDVNGKLRLIGTEDNQLEIYISSYNWHLNVSGTNGNFYLYDPTNNKIPLAVSLNSSSNLTVSTNYISFSTTSTERMRIDASGLIGINTTTAANTQLQIGGTSPTSGNTSYVINLQQTIPAASTTVAVGYSTTLSTAAAAFTCSSLIHFNASQSTIGAGSAITNQYGFIANSNLTGATNNYGFFGNIASGTGRYNFYAGGTADNYFNGSVGVGVTPTAKLNVLTTSTSDCAVFYGTGGSNYLSIGGFASSVAYCKAFESTVAFGNIFTGSTIFLTGNTERVRIDNAGNLLIGVSTSSARFYLSGNATFANQGTSGVRLRLDAATITDSSTAASGTVATVYGDTHKAITLAATNTAVTYTNAYGAYFEAPLAGTNVTLTNKWALGADSLNVSGAANFGSTLSVTGHLTVEGVTSTGATGTGKFAFDTAPTLSGVTFAAGTATVAPIKLTSGTNLTTATAGAEEYDGTIFTATPSISFGRGTIPVTNYTSGTGTALGTNTEATKVALLPAANDTITLPIGTYFIDISFIITRGPTSITSATARLNLLGSGTAAGSFSGSAYGASTAQGALLLYMFDAVNINVDNVLTAASTTAASVYTMTMRGVLKITTAGTFVPQYSLSANINAAGTVAKVYHFNLQQMDTQSAAAAGPSGTGWA